MEKADRKEFNRQDIERVLPHREPMLLVDKLYLQDGLSVGEYTIKGDEWFLQGHFPDKPVVPGVILCEMMGQSSCLLVEEMRQSIDSSDGKPAYTPYFTAMDKVRFRKPVKPGDTVVFKASIKRVRKPFYFISCEGFVSDELCVSGELSFAVVKE